MKKKTLLVASGKVFLLVRINLNDRKNIISKALGENKISHENFTKIMNEKKICRELIKTIRIMKSKRTV